MGKICGCCDLGVCGCGTVTPPTITISGYTGGGWVDVSDCCKSQTFTPNSSLISTCCDDLFEKTWEQTCLRKAWAVKQTFPYDIIPASCPPDPAKYCTPDPPLLHVGTQTEYYYEKQRMRFKINYDRPTITVYFGRDNFTCGGATACKWFMKVKVCYTVESEYEVAIDWTTTLTTESAHPCFTANTFFDGTTTSAGYPRSSSCTVNWVPGCSSVTGEACFERIKIWDTLPADGVIAFTNTDLGDECEVKPSCASVSWRDTQICFAAVGSLGDCDLCWQDYDIITDSTTYTFGGNTVTTINGFTGCGPGGECTPATVNCNANPTVCPTVSQTLVCQSVVFNDDGLDACTCLPRQPALGLICPKFENNADGIPVLCGFFANSSAAVKLFTSAVGLCTDTPCDATCCNNLSCNECSICQPKYVPLFWDGTFFGSQEITINTTCSGFNDVPTTCCIDFATVSLTVDFA